MSKWIDAEWLMNFFVDIPNNFTLTIGNLRATVNDAPSIEIVRCGECKHENSCEHRVLLSTMWDEVEDTADIEYCSYGEREGE